MGNFLRPSNAGAWVVCHGQPALAALYPEAQGEDDNEAARWGTAAHWLAAGAITCRMPAALYRKAMGKNCDFAPNGVPVDDEMIETASVYVDHVLKSYGGADLHIEEFVKIPYIHPTENEGTPDLWWYERGCLDIIDFKGGFRWVDHYENWQAIDYVAGILDLLPELEPGVDLEIRITIVQPRAYHPEGPIRTWVTSRSQLQPYFDKLRAAATAAYLADPLVTVNPHCRDCRGRHACQGLAEAAYDAAEFSASSSPMELSPTALSTELRILQRAQKMLDARVSGLEAQGLAMGRRGDMLPHFLIDHVKGRKRWAKPVEEVLALGQMMGVDLAKPPAAITPTQAKDLGISADLIDAYAEIPQGAAKLVADTGRKARLVFSR